MSEKVRLLSNTSCPDNNEGKQIEQRLLLLESAVEASISGIGITDLNGKLIYVNPTHVDMFGYDSPEEMLGKNIINLTKEEGKVQRLMETLRAGGAKVAEVVIKRKDGTEITVELRASVITDASGQPIAMTASLLDITERRRAEEELRRYGDHLEELVEKRTAELSKTNEELLNEITNHRRAEEALRESEERYRVLFSSGNDAIFVHRMTTDGRLGKFIEVNAIACQRLGYSREELLTLSVADIRAPEDLGKDGTPIVDKLLANKHILFEAVQLAKDGRRIPVEVNTRLFELNGQPTVFSIARDITERKRVEHELKETQEKLVRSEKLATIGQLAGGIGHELRNPLGAIKNAVYYVKGKVSKSELGQKEPQVMEFLEIMEDEINTSNKIISDLVGFSRMSRPSVSPARIEKVIEDALLHTAIPENIELTKKLDTDLPGVEIDPDQIRQVFVNVITNAVQAMPEGGKLTVAAREKGRFLEVEVTDTGGGIPEESVDKIFEPLFTTKAQGIGLGLAVCKAIIDRHEGNIEVKSKMGKGTIFSVKLPLKRKQKSNIGGK